jgi:hypothetical protein
MIWLMMIVGLILWERGTKSRPCMVYLTWSEIVQGFIKDGTLIVGDPGEKTKAHDEARGLLWGK